MKSEKDIKKLSALSDLSGKNWSWVKLGDVCRIVYGKGLPTKNLLSKGYPVFGANSVIGFFNEYLYEESQVLISCRGAYSGKINFSPPKSYITNNSLVIEILEEKKLFKKYLYFSLINSKKDKLVTGTAQPQVTINNAVELSIPLPPLSEQKKIVEKIEELFSSLDSGVASLKKAKEQLRLYRQSVLAFAFSGKLTTKVTQNTKNLSELSDLSGLPQGWKWVKLGEVTNNFDGQRIPLSKEVRAKRKGEYRYYGATEIIDYIDDYIFDGTYLLIGEDGANLLSRSRPLSFIVEGKFWVNNHAHVLQTTDDLNIKYLNYYFNSIVLDEFITGSAQPKLTQKNLNKISIPFAPANQQQQIVSEIEKRFSEADNLEKAIDESLVKSEALRQSILKQAFEGKLV